MALYKYAQELTQTDHANFDAVHAPGNAAPDAGIYKCAGCGLEIGLAHGHTLPPQNHHQHGFNAGPIRWKLIVAVHTR